MKRWNFVATEVSRHPGLPDRPRPRFPACMCALATLLLLGTLAQPASAKIYVYVDERGVPHYSNVQHDARYREYKPPPFIPPILRLPREVRGTDTRFLDEIERAARLYRVDPALVAAIIRVESDFQPRAVSPKGAQGLMQLMPATASRLGVRNVFDPEENIRGGTRHMRSLLDTFNNNLDLSLAAYNAGENLVQRVGGIPNIKETRDYVRSVKKYGRKETTILTAEQPRTPSTFRWVDQKGVLHLTNIPPVQRSEPDFSLLVSSSQSP